MDIYLADLGHNQLTVSSDTYPLGVASLASYLKAQEEPGEPLQVRIFREPDRLRAALDESMPDILGLSDYAWNHNLSLAFARYAKTKSDDVLTVFGGPHWPLTAAEQESFLRSLPEVDVACQGAPYEAERSLLHLVQRYAQAGKAREALFAEPVPGNVWIDPASGGFVHGGAVERILDLDEIPSPYLGGWMEPYLETGYFPMLQISRGCPFTCAFCNSAVKANNGIYRHSVEYMKEELFYLAERVKKETPVCFADDNFGMYPWDEEVADYIRHLQDRFGWPQYIRTTTGKNRSDRIIRVMRKVQGSLPMTAAVQSLNPTVLENIERDNISLQAYADIQKEVQAQGMQAYGELILCLPGETKESFMQAVSDLLDAGVKRVSAHQLMLLHGAPLSNPDRRVQHGFETRFRVVARNISDYLDEPVIETEEIVIATPTFTFEDYLEARVFHLLLTIFFYEDNFAEAFALAQGEGIKPFDLVTALHRRIDQAPNAFRGMLDDFVRESREELFDSAEECIAWSLDHFDQLVSGEVGGNLLSKYSMIGRFLVTAEALDFLQAGIAGALGDGLSKEKQEALAAVMDYLRAVVLSSPFSESLADQPDWHTLYDVERWRDDGYERSLDEYRFEGEQLFMTEIEPERRALIESRIETFGDHPSGLGKFTRTMFARDLRRRIVRPS